jgi:hypothetical protein
MKFNLVEVVLALTVIMVGAVGLILIFPPDPLPPTRPSTPRNVKVPDGEMTWVPSKLEHEGHIYVVFKSGSHQVIVHDPNCPCHKKGEENGGQW